MTLLRHMTIAFFTLCLCVLILLIIGCTLDKIFLFSNNAKQVLHEEIDLFPRTLSLLNLWEFRYIINNNVCSRGKNKGETVAALIVTSYAGDLEGRRAIRLAYPSDELGKLGIRRVFLLALLNPHKNDGKYNTVSQSELEFENEQFSDLVQGNFYEAYRNLTYKHIMGLQWAANYCKDVKFVIKMDDDIIVDFNRLMDFLKRREVKGGELLMGFVIRAMKPVHDKSNKWFVTRGEYSKSLYPPFLSGWLYVTTPQIADRLVKTSKNVRFFWIDDTYVTGILAKTANIRHIAMNEKFAVHSEYLECCIDLRKGINYTCDYIVGPNGGDNELMLKFKKLADYCYIHNCPRREANKAINKTCVTKKKAPPLGKGRAKIVPFKLF